MDGRLLAACAALVVVVVACGASSLTPAPGGGAPDGGTLAEDGGTGGVGGGGEDGGVPAGACPSAGKTAAAGKVDASEVDEASGIAASARNQGVFWVHNDSGDSARAFALGPDGKLLATLAFDGNQPRDIEDMAIEDDGAGASFLYFGDIGDNDEVREEIVIHRVAEPKLGGDAKLSATSEKMTVTYADGAHNAETLLFDPATKDLLVATKKLGGPSAIHRIGPFAAGQKVKTEKIAEVDVDLATGGEISRDGRLIAIRNYGRSAFVWMRGPGESVADAMKRTPCKLPVATEQQGEAFAFLPDGKGYVTISEGASPELHVTPLQ